MAKQPVEIDTDTFLVIVRDLDENAGTRGSGDVTFGDGASTRLRRQPINKKDLVKQMDTFCSALGEVVDSAATRMGNYELDEVTLTVEIAASGQLTIFGASGSVTGTGGLEFKFKRKKSPMTPRKPVKRA